MQQWILILVLVNALMKRLPSAKLPPIKRKHSNAWCVVGHFLENATYKNI
jgi:hypothetical protein